MKNWEKTLIRPESTIRKAMEIIGSSGLQIALVVNGRGILLGTVTDGDIRRALLKNIPLDTSVDQIMCSEPVIYCNEVDIETIREKAKIKNVNHIPIVDENGILVDLETTFDLSSKTTLDNPIVIMAGGMGTRLRPLTNKCPKPMLEVGGKPILETLISNFAEYGFHNFYLSVNYMSELIEEHFKNGSQWGITINYLRENTPLGTAGSLSLLKPAPSLPIIVINGDVLTKVNFKHLLNFHNEHKACATMCVREYTFQVPFGVAIADKQHLISIEEKPKHQFLVNAGIYVLNPEVLPMIPHDEFYDMPPFFEKLITLKKETIVFPIHEYWLDIGRIDDLERANSDASSL